VNISTRMPSTSSIGLRNCLGRFKELKSKSHKKCFLSPFLLEKHILALSTTYMSHRTGTSREIAREESRKSAAQHL